MAGKCSSYLRKNETKNIKLYGWHGVTVTERGQQFEIDIKNN